MLPCPLRASRAELEFHCRRAAAAIPYGKHQILCRILGHWAFLVDRRDRDIAPHLCLDGFWEPWVTLALARAARPGCYCIDVGASYGYYSLLMAVASAPNGLTIACEPNPSFQRYLRRNKRLNDLKYTIKPTACSDQTRDAYPYSTPLPIGGAHLTERTTTHNVPTTTLDDLTQTLPHCHIVKVDVEGHELAVWRGAPNLRQRHNPIWLIELHTLTNQTNATTLLEEIRAAGYPLRVLNADGDLLELSPTEIIQLTNPHLWISTA